LVEDCPHQCVFYCYFYCYRRISSDKAVVINIQRLADGVFCGGRVEVLQAQRVAKQVGDAGAEAV
jgi:hypothetical protein